jgi:hypothetical protein
MTDIKRQLNLEDKIVVRQYLKKKMTNNKIFKGPYFYKNIIKLYYIYPIFTKNFIDNIYITTNYNDYFRILEYCEEQDKQIYDYIMKLIVEKYLEDEKKYLDNDNLVSVSMLPKWMPRKDGKYDRQLNFVDKFIKIVYPNLDKQVAFKKYRVTVSNMTKLLNPIEQKLCKKELGEIDYNNITYNNFKVYYNTLWQYPEKMTLYINKRYSKFNFLINRFLYIFKQTDKNKYQREIEILENIWTKKKDKYINKYNEKISLEDTVIVLDLSQRMVNYMLRTIVKLYLLGLYNSGFVIFNKKNPVIVTQNKNNIIENIKIFTENITSSLKIDETKLIEMAKNSGKSKVLLVTEKHIQSTDNLKVLKINNNKLIIKENIISGNPFYKVNNMRIEKKNILVELINYGELKPEKRIKNIKKTIIITVIIIIIVLLLFCLFIN